MPSIDFVLLESAWPYSTSLSLLLSLHYFPFSLVGGFQFFAKHQLCLAGISLAMLYLTVLGFDSITISFCKASGVDESLVSSWREKNTPNLPYHSHQQVGLLMGVSSLLGFLGSVTFPLLRAKLGTPVTALIGAAQTPVSLLQYLTHSKEFSPCITFDPLIPLQLYDLSNI